MMDERKTREQLIEELQGLRQQVAELEERVSKGPQEEKKWRSLLQHAPERIVTLDRSGKILFLNRTCSDGNLDEVVGTSAYTFLTPSEQSKLKDILDSVFESGQPQKYVTPVVKKDGTHAWCESRVAPILHGGKVTEVMVVTADVTERVQAEEALRASEAKYRQIVERVPVGIYQSTGEGKFLTVNSTLVNMLGYASRKELLCVSIPRDVYFSPAEREAVIKEFRQHHKGVFVYRLKKKDGTKLWVEDYMLRIGSGEGSPDYYEGVVLDITERKEAEQALKESEKKYRTLVESTNAIPWKLNQATGRFTYMGKQVEQVLGYPAESWIDLNVWKERIHPDDREGAYQSCLNAADGVEDHDFEYRAIASTGEVVWIRDVVTVMTAENSSRELVGFMMDITERKRLEQQLLQSQKMEAIGRLAGGVAHDFNNLLMVVLGNAEFGLRDIKPGERGHEELLQIETAAIQARELTTQLLTFSKKHAIEPKLVQLNRLILDQTRLLKRVIGEHIHIETHLDADLSPVMADPAQIQQVLMNLTVNARDAMPKGGRLTIATRNFVADERWLYETAAQEGHADSHAAKNFVQMSVSDTGVGMDEETRAHVFEPFYTTRGVGQGTGLGLAVAYGIVKRHHGVIQIESQRQKGATFHIFLPAVTLPASERVNTRTKETIPGGWETILVVEDEDAVLKVTGRILSGLGYRVLTARSGKEGLSVFQQQSNTIDLVIIDVVMPEMSGIDTYKALNLMSPDLPVIFVTGYDVHSAIPGLSSAEQESYVVLQKPFTKETLGKKVREVLTQELQAGTARTIDK